MFWYRCRPWIWFMGLSIIDFRWQPKMQFWSRFRRPWEVNFSQRQRLREFSKIFIIHFTMFLIHKKKIVARSHSWVSQGFVKVGANCQKICPILRSTSVCCVFVKTGGVGQNFGFWFSYLMLLRKVPNLFYSQQHHSRTPHTQTRFLWDIFSKMMCKYSCNWPFW